MKTLSMFKLLPLVAAGAALVGSGAADAMTLTLYDAAANGGLGYTETLTDGGTGIVTFNQALGHGSLWSANITTGLSDTTGIPQWLDLNTQNANSSGAGDLVITLTESFPIPATTPFLAKINGATAGSANVQITEVATSNTFGVFAPSPGTFGDNNFHPFPNTLTGGYDLQIQAVFHHGAAGQSNFDAYVQAVPIPAAALLFGSALLGMAGVGRRKAAQG